MGFAASICALVALVALSSPLVNASSSVAYIAGESPLLRPYVYSAHSSSVITPSQQQYHTQDDLGQYAYGYAEPLSAKQEVRSLDGVTRGSYSYRDAAGKLQTVDYKADANGFHVAATNLPRAAVAASEEQTQQQIFRAPEATVALTAIPTIAAVPSIAAISAASRDVHVAAARPSLVRLPARNIVGGQSAAADPAAGDVQLPQSVDDTIAVAAAKTATHHHLNQYEARLFQPTVVPTTVPVAYQASPFYGYSYNYPWRYYYY